jgi:hypothetical protein
VIEEWGRDEKENGEMNIKMCENEIEGKIVSPKYRVQIWQEL